MSEAPRDPPGNAVSASASASASASVSVILAAYQEELTITSVVRGCAEHTAGLCEVIVVDDGSTDGTAERAAAAGARVLRLPRNGGKGVAIRHGIESAHGDCGPLRAHDVAL